MRLRAWSTFAGACLLLTATNSNAQSQFEQEYTNRLKIHQTIDPHGPTPFGEELNPYTGDLTFTQVDLVLEGIGPPIQIARNAISPQYGEAVHKPYSMGNWALAIPRIETLTHADWHVAVAIDPGRDWFVRTGSGNSTQRCTFFNRPAFNGTLDDPTKGWNGMTLVTADGGRQSVLKRDAALNAAKPSIPEASLFPAVTQQFWQIGCLPQTSNGEEGEAFIAVSPDGTKYWLDHLQGVRVEGISEPDPAGSGQWLRQGRMLASMYVTRIEDRFGNWVEYHYNGEQLAYIDAKDGRRVDFTWIAVGDAHLISEIRVQSALTTRKWTYAYATSIGPDGWVSATLTNVTLPDQSQWTFALAGLSSPVDDMNQSFCGRLRDESGLATSTKTYRTATVTHPSGLIGTFQLESTWHGRSYVQSVCTQDLNHVLREAIPPLFGTMSLVAKTFSGPGIPTQTWTFDYSPAVGSTIQDPCASQNTCQDTSWVDVRDPKGNRTRHVYKTHWGPLEGKEIETHYYENTSTLLRSVTMSYAPETQGPYPASLGSSMMGWTNNSRQEKLTPLEERIISQQGAAFTHDVADTGFDSFAREVDATDTNSLGPSRRVQTTYHDNQADWVLGQIATRTVGGHQVERTDYDSDDQPWKTYAYGKLQKTMTYAADGTLHTVTDGANNTTTLSSWYRGIPTQLSYADGTSQSAVVDGQGWITSVTDAAGSRTCYGYDAMGRVSNITHPSEASSGVCDSSAWNATNITFVPVATAEYGIPAGHWRQTINTGNARKETFFDALWRPVLVREHDTGDVAATQRFNATSYEPGGQANYQAYPMGTAPGMVGGYWTQGGDATASTMVSPMGSGDPEHCYPYPQCEGDPPPPPPLPTSTLPGIHTVFDALGRVTAVKQDSELGVLTTTTAYLAGFKRQTTDPLGNVTVEQFQAFGAPSYDAPIQVDAPENTRTTIVRDVFGKPLEIQRGATN